MSMVPIELQEPERGRGAVVSGDEHGDGPTSVYL